MKISIVTLGCRANQAESLDIERELLKAGHDIVSNGSKADIGVVNTCAVTSRAERQSRQEIYRTLKKASNVIVTGCFAQLNHDIVKDLDPRVSIFRNEDKHLIPESVASALRLDPAIPLKIGRSRPAIKIQDGCNYRCSYCVIPMARGRSRSQDKEEILRKIEWHHAQGAREVVLTGIHLGAYGHDMTPRSDLASLIEDILQNTGIARVRMSSIEIHEVSDRLIEVLRNPRVCSHLHIPLQSGDDSILRKMKRHYNTDYYVMHIKQLVSMFPMIGLGTDIMVGFPGEGCEEFENTYNLLKDLPFSYIHVFPFSARPGTEAFHYGPVVSERDKHRRVKRLRELGELKRKEYIRGNLNTTQWIILEEENNGIFQGTSGNYLKVAVRAKGLRKGMLLKVLLTRHDGEVLWGIPIDSQEALLNKSFSECLRCGQLR